ncbi:MAG TPA: hypothetical protein VHM23_14010 [Actinomycetota bacterium]|nr:hypothetical protein [Actinomycetota bacterium]
MDLDHTFVARPVWRVGLQIPFIQAAVFLSNPGLDTRDLPTTSSPRGLAQVQDAGSVSAN